MSQLENRSARSLRQALEERGEMISNGVSLTRETKELFDAYGKDVLSSSYDRFAELEKSLDAKEVRMVVIGEFSRGKSSLLNALLGITQLPTASESTTAINTFIYGLPEGEAPYLRIAYRNGTTEDLPILNDDQQALRKWGTELEHENKDARMEVDQLDLHIHHPLLDLGLVLIDTPGLESIQPHHEEITYRAIDSAHIAIWVQATTQLGGNKREWEFLKTTICKSFRKFITVINWWDMVLDPDDEQDKRTPKNTRIRQKLALVRNRFRDYLAEDIAPAELSQLTSDDNLFGVSARWALSGTDEQKEESGIDKLANRIKDMCLSNEAVEEIFSKPMKQLSELQASLKTHLDNCIAALENTDSIEKQRQDIERLKADIDAVELELKNINTEASVAHQRLAGESVSDLKKDIIEPLFDLKQAIESYVTRDYVRGKLAAKKGTIGLPDDLQNEYEAAVGTINDKIAAHRNNITAKLQQLRLDYSEAMNKYMGEMATSFSALDIELPKMDVSCNIDLTEIENFYSEKLAMEQEMEVCRDDVAQYEERIQLNASDEAAIEAAREAVLRMERRIHSHGMPPSPIVVQKSREVSPGGTWRKARYESYEELDYSNVEEWRKIKAELDGKLENSEKDLQRIIAAEHEKTGRRLSMEQAMRRRERELEQLKHRLEKKQHEMEKEQEKLVNDAFNRLLRNTSGQLDKYIRLLQQNAEEGVTTIFDQHLKYLQTCVTEQFTEKLKSKESSRNAALETLQQGEQEITRRREELAAASARLEDLAARTRQQYCYEGE